MGRSGYRSGPMSRQREPVGDTGAVRITAVGLQRLSIPLDPPFPAAWDPVPRTMFTVTLVRVETDQGVVGIGSGDTMDGFEAFEHLFVGRDPLEIERHVRVLETIDFHAGRYWPLEAALWDIAGQVTGKPVAALFGGKLDAIPAYASCGMLLPAPERAESALRMREEGFRAMKISGSLDGDSAAAMRYTECRLARISDEMLTEIEQATVPFRPNYDGTKTEPVVLPARLPNLLINGATGIAVGMATNIPPHNLGEVCTALIKLLDNDELSNAQLCRYVKGPDFPTGGQILNSQEELKQIYKTGSGSIRLRGTWDIGPETRSTKTIYIDSIPYTVNKSQLVEQIAEVVISRKLPPLLDVKDLSTEDVRIAIEMKKDADEKMVMAYLFKHTPLQINFAVNLTCLEPTEHAEVGRPARLDLKTILRHFLLFRLEVVTKRLEHELAALKKRIHLLEGFEKVFDALDEIIRIIRKSDGKADAADKIMKRFELDAEQTDAILELKIYRLARLEILIIRNELDEKRKRARQIGTLLKDEDSRWKLVRSELEEIQKKYGDAKIDKRRTLLESDTGEPEYTADDFIVEEDNVVIVSRDGWVKRQKDVKDLSTTRLREGDAVLAAFAGSTRATLRVLQQLWRRVYLPHHRRAGVHRLRRTHPAAVQAQGRREGRRGPQPRSARTGDVKPSAKRPDDAPPVHGVAVTSDGYSLRFSLEPLVEPSTRAGRRFARPAKDAEVVGVAKLGGGEVLIAATAEGRGLLCKAEEVNYLSGPGKGVILIKLGDDDRVLGFIASSGDRDLLTVETTRGAEQTISTAKYEVTGRGGKGRELLQRGQFTRVLWPAPEAPAPLSEVQ